MSNVAFSLPSSTILPGSVNLTTLGNWKRPNQRTATQHTQICMFVNSPEEVRFCVKLQICAIDEEVKLGGSGVGNTGAEDQEVWILAQLKCRSYHCEGRFKVKPAVRRWSWDIKNHSLPAVICEAADTVRHLVDGFGTVAAAHVLHMREHCKHS